MRRYHLGPGFEPQAGTAAGTLTLLFSLGLLTSACGDSALPSEGAPPDSLTAAVVMVTPPAKTLVYVGERLRLQATAMNARNEILRGMVFDWSSSDSTVVSVAPDGWATARAVGRARITAEADGRRGWADLTVDPEQARFVCLGCHTQAQHARTLFPGTSCAACHRRALEHPLDHRGAEGAHVEVAAGFDLIGIHGALSCGACHDLTTGAALYEAGGPTDCIACHRVEYDSRHAGTGFPTTCLSCHSVFSWTGVAFDHAAASGGFALLGAHSALTCTRCHEPGTWQPRFTPRDHDDCIACHQSDYDARHGASGYPTTCLACHNRTTFAGASFNHDAQYFPIYSGEHRGEWSSCATCHTDPANYSTFSCFGCHKHNQADMDKKHGGRQGYSYDSRVCLGCHPRP